jgi:hypothetical protein
MAPPIKNTRGTCAKCGESNPAAFTPSALKRRTAWCRKCTNAYKQEVQPNGRPRASRYQATRRKKNVEWLWKIKAERGCERCGEKDPCCLDFHHRNAATKAFPIGTKVHLVGRAKAEAELAKCIILCSNCHRKLHYHEKSGTYAPRP